MVAPVGTALAVRDLIRTFSFSQMASSPACTQPARLGARLRRLLLHVVHGTRTAFSPTDVMPLYARDGRSSRCWRSPLVSLVLAVTLVIARAVNILH